MRRLWPRTPFSRAWLVRACWVYAAIVLIRLHEAGPVLPQLAAVLAATCLWAYVRDWVDVTTVAYVIWPAIVVTGAMAAVAAQLEQAAGGALAALLLVCGTGWWMAEDSRRMDEVRSERRRRLELRGVAPVTGVDPQLPGPRHVKPRPHRLLDLEPVVSSPARGAATGPSTVADDVWTMPDGVGERPRHRVSAGV